MKGPQLEWYLKSKFWMEKDYRSFHELIPEKADVLDLGCGYGHMDLLFALLSPERKIHGVDHDAEKIRMAQECPSRPENLSFEVGDAESFELPESDVFLMGDLLHYLPLSTQKRLIEGCMEKLRAGGRILIRDADRDRSELHERTEWTEFFSTRFGFNKARYQLEFVSGQELREWVEGYGMEISTRDESTSTSNLLYVIQEKGIDKEGGGHS